MKFDNPDPQRVADDSASDLGRLVRASRAKRPKDGAVGRMADRLAAAGAFGAATHVATKTSFFGQLGGYKTAVVVLLGIASAAFFWQTRSVSPTIPDDAAPVENVAAPRAEAKAASDTPTEAPSIAVEALPSTAAPIASAATRPSRPASDTRAPSSASDTRAPSAEVEFALVQHAEDALATDPSRALALAEEHARTFPSGQLVQEREVVAVEALVRLGRRDAAKARANAMLARFPRTPYVARLERALGEPLSPPSKAR